MTKDELRVKKILEDTGATVKTDELEDWVHNVIIRISKICLFGKSDEDIVRDIIYEYTILQDEELTFTCPHCGHRIN